VLGPFPSPVRRCRAFPDRNGDTPIQDLRYWDALYTENPEVFGTDPTPFALECGELLVERGVEQMVMDLGSGYGRDSVALARYDLEVMPLDASEVAIGLLQRRVSGTPLVTMVNPVWNDILDDLPVSDDFFSAVYSWNFFNQDFSDEETDFILGEIYRSLLPGGFLMLGVRSTHDPLYGRGEEVGPNYYRLDGRSRRFWTPEYAEAKLEDYAPERMEQKSVAIAGTDYGVLEIIAVK
jgi:SAM-dependent methyltransferase